MPKNKQPKNKDLMIYSPFDKREEMQKVLEGLNMKIEKCSRGQRNMIVGGQADIFTSDIVLFEVTTDEKFEIKLKEALDKAGLRGPDWAYIELKKLWRRKEGK